MEWVENADLRLFNTFGVSARAKHLLRVHDQAEAEYFFKQFPEEPYLILGGGSNVLFCADWHGKVLLNAIQGKSIEWENQNELCLNVHSGENWHALVMHCVEMGWGGIENLALIPGKVGAAPMQNIGAYGVEIGDVLEFVDVLEITTGKCYRLNCADCMLGYRDSFFKQQGKNRFLILSVGFRLQKNPRIHTEYGAIRDSLEKAGIPIQKAGIADVAAAVISIRQSKLPDPLQIGNAGSFFKNPVVSDEQAEKLKQNFSGIVHFPQPDGRVKLAAGWLIEQAGFKGIRRGDAGVHAHQALVLVNYGNASGLNVLDLAHEVQEGVLNRFGVSLEAEVNCIG